MNLIGMLWWICIIVQYYLGLGTAYRLTKAGGDNGVALFGWLFVMNLVSFIPGLGIYLWYKNRDGYTPRKEREFYQNTNQDEPNPNNFRY